VVIEVAIRELAPPQEAPDIVVGPVEDGVDAHEGRPAFRAWAEELLVSGIGIAPKERQEASEEGGRESQTQRVAPMPYALCLVVRAACARMAYC
jgi:hypothetical protein